MGITKGDIRAKSSVVLIRFHALILVCIGFIIGIAAPAPGTYLARLNLGGICFPESKSDSDVQMANTPNINCVYNKFNHILISLIFLVSGIGLEISQIKSALGNLKAVFGGLFLILFITPLLAIPVFTSDMLSSVPDFAFGLGLFLLCPTAIAAGVATVQVANGNVPLGIILTVASNLIGVFTVPVFISLIIPKYKRYLAATPYGNSTVGNGSEGSESVDISVNPVPLITVLFFAVFIPILIGIALRARFQAVGNFAKAHKLKLSLFSNAMNGIITWLQSSASADAFVSVAAWPFFSTFLVFSFVHISYIIINIVFARHILRLSNEDFKSVVIMGIQKSFATSLTLLSMLPENITPSLGLASIPIIISNMIQTLFDFYIASIWAKKEFSTFVFKCHIPRSYSNVSEPKSSTEIST